MGSDYEEICYFVGMEMKIMPSTLFYEGNWFEILSIFIRAINNRQYEKYMMADEKKRYNIFKFKYTKFTQKVAPEINNKSLELSNRLQETMDKMYGNNWRSKN